MDGGLIVGIWIRTFGFAITVLSGNVSECGDPGVGPYEPTPGFSPRSLLPRASKVTGPPTANGRGTLAQVSVEQRNGGNGPPWTVPWHAHFVPQDARGTRQGSSASVRRA